MIVCRWIGTMTNGGEKMPGLTIGGEVWIDCDVRPGPFPDERFVRLNNDAGDWIGFVPVSFLRDEIQEGSTAVRAVVVDVEGGLVTVRLPGAALAASLHKGGKEGIQPIDTVQA